jgi:hypothetical protein
MYTTLFAQCFIRLVFTSLSLLSFLCVQTMMAERAGADPNATATVRRRWLEAAAFHLDTAISK